MYVIITMPVMGAELFLIVGLPGAGKTPVPERSRISTVCFG